MTVVYVVHCVNAMHARGIFPTVLGQTIQKNLLAGSSTWKGLVKIFVLRTKGLSITKYIRSRDEWVFGPGTPKNGRKQAHACLQLGIACS